MSLFDLDGSAVRTSSGRVVYQGANPEAAAARVALLRELAGMKPKPNTPVKGGAKEYADPKNEKYPIDTEEHVRAAISYISVAKNAAEYPLNGVTLGSVKAKIRAAAKKFGIKTDL